MVETPARALLIAAVIAFVVGCGDSSEPAPADAGTPTTRPVNAAYDLTCRDLAQPRARREAVEFVTDVMVAPEGQPRRRTVSIIRRSLRDTCSQQSLPGVDAPEDYRPVKPVRRAVQSHFDQDVIYGR